MEYREKDWPEHGPGGPTFSSSIILILSTTVASITIGLVLCQRWFLLHEVMSPGIMVCVTLIIKTLEYVHLIPFVSNKCLDLILAHLTMSGGDDKIPSKPVFLGFGLPLGGFMKIHHLLPSYYHFYTLFPAHLSHSPCPGIGLTYFQDCTLLRGKKGLKAQKVKPNW